jgi:hypothetical protein
MGESNLLQVEGRFMLVFSFEFFCVVELRNAQIIPGRSWKSCFECGMQVHAVAFAIKTIAHSNFEPKILGTFFFVVCIVLIRYHKFGDMCGFKMSVSGPLERPSNESFQERDTGKHFDHRGPSLAGQKSQGGL